jgi:hypothetical protein
MKSKKRHLSFKKLVLSLSQNQDKVLRKESIPGEMLGLVQALLRPHRISTY